jgi:hypothetical protein
VEYGRSLFVLRKSRPVTPEVVPFHSPVAAISATATFRIQIRVNPIVKVCPDQAVSRVIPRVNSTDQNLDIQKAALKAAGCEVIRSEKRSGTSRPLAD